MYSNQYLANLFLTFTISGQIITLAILIVVLMIFGAALNDDANHGPPTGDHQLEEASLVERKELEPEEKANLTQ